MKLVRLVLHRTQNLFSFLPIIKKLYLMTKRKALELEYESLKQESDTLLDKLRLASIELEDANRQHYSKLLISNLLALSPPEYRDYIHQIRSFDISYKHQFTILFDGNIKVGKRPDQSIYCSDDDMMPFLEWLYTVDINGRCIERIVRDGLRDMKDNPLFFKNKINI